jgi:urea transport system ATP-binding protein
MLNLSQISVSYGDTQIVRGVNMTVSRGELVCLMGRNGVGKSTLLKSIMGLLPLRSGRIDFEGHDISNATPDKRARLGIGYVPQGREIFPDLTVLENLKIGLMANPGRLAEVPDQIYVYFPMLKGILNRKGGVLSGGQQQQLAIARALAANPKLLILDEPTEGIQPSIILLIGQFLETLRKEGRVAVLLVEQYLDFALKLADRCYVMEKGEIAMNGRVETLDKDVIKQYLAF